MADTPDILRGTLDLLILKALSWGPSHGYGVARWIELATDDALALREGAWKYIDPSDGPAVQKNTNTELGNSMAPQLYDLAADPGETRNLAGVHPERVEAMAARLSEIRRASTTRR